MRLTTSFIDTENVVSEDQRDYKMRWTDYRSESILKIKGEHMVVKKWYKAAMESEGSYGGEEAKILSVKTYNLEKEIKKYRISMVAR